MRCLAPERASQDSEGRAREIDHYFVYPILCRPLQGLYHFLLQVRRDFQRDLTLKPNNEGVAIDIKGIGIFGR